MRRSVIPDAEAFAAAVENEISWTTREGRYYHRLHVPFLVLRGFSCHEAARLYRDSPGSVEYLVHRLAAKGLEGLQKAERPGRPPRLSPTQKDRLREDLQRPPRDHPALHPDRRPDRGAYAAIPVRTWVHAPR